MSLSVNHIHSKLHIIGFDVSTQQMLLRCKQVYGIVQLSATMLFVLLLQQFNELLTNKRGGKYYIHQFFHKFYLILSRKGWNKGRNYGWLIILICVLKTTPFLILLCFFHVSVGRILFAHAFCAILVEKDKIFRAKLIFKVFAQKELDENYL